jgi:hydrogenase maturation protein HypF
MNHPVLQQTDDDSRQIVMEAQSIRVRGLVQGVGFRPFVANLARQNGVWGKVWNDAEGVKIHAWASAGRLARFTSMLENSAPPLAQIQAVEVFPLLEPCKSDGFEIKASIQGQTQTAVAADAATCPACLHDIFDPANRRYRYPFTNCTHCGPRLSIICGVPYDRKNTSMSDFSMCPSCQAEYEDEADRRFHAQPNACPECGPNIWLEDAKGKSVPTKDVLSLAAAWIREGRIVAIKGLGGFHLACDACNEEVVSRLRQSKKRYHKPFALMGRNAAQIQDYVEVSGQEQAQLASSEAPVVIMAAKTDNRIAASVAPDQDTLGFMLPYTPLHHLLMSELDGPIVLTSGNVSDEPQCIDNDEARKRLHDIADGYLLHDRDIVNRLDDSVVRVIDGEARVLRRARGFAPSAIVLPAGFESSNAVLAMGGELKNTFCMISHGQAIVSQYMGDLEHGAVLDDYRYNLKLYRQLYDFNLRAVVVDKHPDYFSTQWGSALAADENCQLIEIQHHHAHVAACMAEHGLPLGSRVLGIALDGLGMGSDGKLWGGEFMLASYSTFERLGSIQQAAMIGGAKAMFEPWCNTYAHLHAIGWQEIQERFAGLELIELLAAKPLRNIDVMIEKGLNSPMASSTGRLFDAVAAAVGLCAESVSFEGQAAMALEVAASEVFESEKQAAYPIAVEDVHGLPTLIWQPMWMALLQDLQRGVSRNQIAARFHHGLIRAVSDLVVILRQENNVEQVVLSGGVFQNRLLFEGVSCSLSQAGLQVLAPARFPANDGGLSLGQAVIAVAQDCES